MKGEDKVGKVIDLAKHRERLELGRAGAIAKDGLYMESVPPFIIFRRYEAGVVCSEQRLISEYMLREMLENMT